MVEQEFKFKFMSQHGQVSVYYFVPGHSMYVRLFVLTQEQISELLADGFTIDAYTPYVGPAVEESQSAVTVPPETKL